MAYMNNYDIRYNDGENPVKVFHWSLLSAVLRGLTRGNRSLDQPTGWGLKATALAKRGQTPRGAPRGLPQGIRELPGHQSASASPLIRLG